MLNLWDRVGIFILNTSFLDGLFAELKAVISVSKLKWLPLYQEYLFVTTYREQRFSK